MTEQNREEEIRATFFAQAQWCAALGSPITAQVVRILGTGLDRSTKSGRRVLDWRGNTDARGDSVPLRFAGALNGLVRAGRLPKLARYYPPHGVSGEGDFSQAVLAAVAQRDDEINEWLNFAPQTNEVGRAAVLFAGLCVLSERYGLPLSIYEIGASAGLNLLLDQFEYGLGGVALGASGSQVKLSPDWNGAAAPTVPPVIMARRGCDLNPLDMLNEDHRDRLMAYVWPDQPERLKRVTEAIDIAQTMPPIVDKADAAEWVERMIAIAPEHGVVRVLVHSIAFQYFPGKVQDRIRHHIAKAGARATVEAPIAWLSFESTGDEGPYLTLETWPGGQKQRLARADAHVRAIEWELPKNPQM